jgi:hypothetical protein
VSLTERGTEVSGAGEDLAEAAPRFHSAVVGLDGRLVLRHDYSMSSDFLAFGAEPKALQDLWESLKAFLLAASEADYADLTTGVKGTGGTSNRVVVRLTASPENFPRGPSG